MSSNRFASLVVAVLVLCTITCDASRFKRQADEEPNVALIQWKQLFKEVFSSGKSEVSAKDARQKIEELGKGLENEKIVAELESSLKEEVEFWVEAAKIDPAKCDIEYDDKLIQRYQEAFLRFPISEKKKRRPPIKVFLDDVRDQQLKECKHFPEKLQGLTDDISQNVINVVQKIEQGVSDDYARNAAYVLAHHYGKGSWFDIFSNPLKNKERFEKLYEEEIIKPCEKLMAPYRAMEGFVKYAKRYNLRQNLDLSARDWLHTYVDICKNFVLEQREETKQEVFEALPNVVSMYRIMSSGHQAMYLQDD